MWRIYTVIAYFVLALVIPIGLASLGVWRRMHRARIVTCPADGGATSIALDCCYAMRMHALGNPEFRVQECGRWPERSGCGQNCLVQFS